jgi:hypothetical protein
MGVTLAWIALALAGVAGAPSAERDKPQITYTVRMVDTEGVRWREAVYTRLKPVTRQGAARVWTIPHDATARLLTEVTKCPASKILQAPAVTSSNGTPATIQCRNKRQLVTQAAWNGREQKPEGPPENVRVGWYTTVIGRKLDQGILVQVVFEDTIIRAIHHVNVAQTGDPKCTMVGKSEPEVCAGPAGLMAIAQAALGIDGACAEHCANTGAGCQAGPCTANDRDVQKVVLDVPEIDTHEVLGEWLIPSGEALLVSFGAFTIADKDGKALVKERLALIDADVVAGATPVRRRRVWVPALERPLVAPPAAALPGAAVGPALAPIVAPPAAAVPDPLPRTAMPAPVLPSRSFPQGIHADGTKADLPPLPADETEPNSAESESSQPMPSPQTKKPHRAKPAADAGTSKTEFAQPKASPLSLPSLFMPGPSTGFQFLLPIKPFSFKLPFGQRLELEVLGRIVPDRETR